MTWIDVALTILSTTGIVGLVLLTLGLLARSLYGQVLSRDLETHKANLILEAEKFRANIEKTAFEHHVRFESTHEKIAEIIGDLYKRMVKANNNVILLANFNQHSGEIPRNAKINI